MRKDRCSCAEEHGPNRERGAPLETQRPPPPALEAESEVCDRLRAAATIAIRSPTGAAPDRPSGSLDEQPLHRDVELALNQPDGTLALVGAHVGLEAVRLA